jgi:hypothetical protein
MDATEFLKMDHEKAKQAFFEIENAQPQMRGQLWGKLARELKVHEEIEALHFYGPVAQDARDPILQRWPDHHREEVAKAEGIIQEIDRMAAADERWIAKVRELKDMLAQHIHEEENDIWPKARQAWSRAKLEQAGQHMEAAKSERMRHAALRSGPGRWAAVP